MYSWEYATAADFDKIDAETRGESNPDVAWVLTNRDVWHSNPFYKGEPVAHPLDEESDYLNYVYLVDRLDAIEARGGPKFSTPAIRLPDDPF